MKLILGLGNPGDTYYNTRHNLGFMVLDHFLQNQAPPETSWSEEKTLKSITASFLAKTMIGEAKILLAKPQTYMNNAGMAVALLTRYFAIASEDVFVLHDDIDLPLGSLRIRRGGSSAGHHGVDSVMKALDTDQFWRFRLGIGHPKRHGDVNVEKRVIHNVEDFVIAPFASDEQGKVRKLIKHAAAGLYIAVKDGIEKAANIYNTK